MTIERLVMAFAGSFILMSVGLAMVYSLDWLWFTGFCPLALVLKRFGVKSGCAF